MIKKIHITFLLLIILILTVYLNRSYISRNIMKYEYRVFLKKILLPIQIKEQKRMLSDSSKRINRIRNKYIEQTFPLIVKSKSTESFFGNNNILLNKFDLSALDIFGPRAYLTQSNKYIYLGYGDKAIFRFIKPDINSPIKEINLEVVRSNLYDSSKKTHNSFFDKSSIKNILATNEHLYVSEVYKEKPYCFKNRIVYGKINEKPIDFKTFYEIPECQPQLTLQTGGNIENYGDSILLTIGDHDSYIRDFGNKNPQNPDSVIGKIISINKKNKEINIISMGHRNPQGLYYDETNDIIYSTEHGPEGGDEININNLQLSNENKIKNFGWGIASYGEHYGGKIDYNKRNYEMAPLKKSHSDYGFIEPFKYFTPSIGITSIIKLDNFFKKGANKNLIIGAMGNDPEVGNSLYKIELVEGMAGKVSRLEGTGRVRDIIISKKDSVIYFYSETASVFYMLQAK